MGEARSHRDRVEIAVQVFASAGIPARGGLGLVLEEGHGKEALPLIEVYTGTRWQFFDMRKGEAGLPENMILWRRQGTSLLDLHGGHDATVRFDLLQRTLPAEFMALERADNDLEQKKEGLSLYDLPLAQQNTFKMLLLIPLAALIVAIARNMIGLKTSGHVYASTHRVGISRNIFDLWLDNILNHHFCWRA